MNEKQSAYAIEMAKNNAECLRRLMMIVANSSPHTSNEIGELFTEWRRVQSDIDSEFFDV